ncbi:MAG: 50S ribosomal protein L6 [Opitutales bacterium]
MSRIGKLPITLPNGVTVEFKDSAVAVKGPKGSLEKDFYHAVKVSLNDSTVNVTPADNSRHSRAMYGTARAIIANMVTGVSEGYTSKLEIHGVGFRAALKGDTLDLSLGYSHPIHYKVPEGVTVTVNENTKVTVQGIDKQIVGSVCADIRRFYPPEPYKGKGVRFSGEQIRRKEGKTVS